MIGTNLPAGTEIVCRDAKARDYPVALREGVVYTVRGYSVGYSGYVSVLLNEVMATQDDIAMFWPSGERGFYRDRFSLLEISSVFREMLERINQGEHEPCLSD